MRRRRFLTSLLLGSALLGSALAADHSNGVPKSLLSKFTTGVNITRWFCYLAKPSDTKHYAEYMVDDDFARFRQLKLGYVRLCVSPEAIYQGGKPNAANLPFLDKAIARLEKAGLAVILDLHDNGQLKLDAEGQDNSGFVSFWQAMSRHYRGKHKNSVVFELVNEPVFQKNAEVWYALQEKTVKAVRAIDPSRTIMASGTGWGGIDGLTKLPLLPVKNVIYSYHCYDPFLFTHQGASWVGEQQKTARSIPFPSSPEAVDAIIDLIPEQFQKDVRWYGEQRYDEAYLRGRIKLCVDWAAKNHVPAILGEFGAYPPVSPPESRARWFAAMRRVFDGLKVSHCVWGYDDALGLGRERRRDGSVKLDVLTLKNLYGK